MNGVRKQLLTSSDTIWTKLSFSLQSPREARQLAMLKTSFPSPAIQYVRDLSSEISLFNHLISLRRPDMEAKAKHCDANAEPVVGCVAE